MNKTVDILVRTANNTQVILDTSKSVDETKNRLEKYLQAKKRQEGKPC